MNSESQSTMQSRLCISLHPEIFSGQEMNVSVDCSDGVNRGMTICDTRSWSDAPKNALVLTDADSEKFETYLMEAILSHDKKWNKSLSLFLLITESCFTAYQDLPDPVKTVQRDFRNRSQQAASALQDSVNERSPVRFHN